jgi:hypothetical protein
LNSFFNRQNTGEAAPRSLKQYLPDVLAILLIAGGAYLFSGKPDLDLTARPLPNSQSAKDAPRAQTVGKQPEGAAGLRQGHDYRALQARNIFAVSGGYAEADAKSIPEQAYTLIGVLSGKEMKAVFKDYTGAVLTMTAGKKMIDGFVISRIEGTAVKLRRGHEEKVLRTFYAPDPAKTIERKGADGSVVIVHTGDVPDKTKLPDKARLEGRRR